MKKGKKKRGNPATMSQPDDYDLGQWFCVPSFRSGLLFSKEYNAHHYLVCQDLTSRKNLETSRFVIPDPESIQSIAYGSCLAPECRKKGVFAKPSTMKKQIVSMPEGKREFNLALLWKVAIGFVFSAEIISNLALLKSRAFG